MNQEVRVRILFKGVGEVGAVLDLERNRKTTESVIKALPIRGRVNRWGDEIYFSTSVRSDEENSQEEVEVGDIAFWPPGSALCFFFGRTPASIGSEPRAASPVNVIGRISGDLNILRNARDGCEVRVELI